MSDLDAQRLARDMRTREPPCFIIRRKADGVTLVHTVSVLLPLSWDRLHEHGIAPSADSGYEAVECWLVTGNAVPDPPETPTISAPPNDGRPARCSIHCRRGMHSTEGWGTNTVETWARHLEFFGGSMIHRTTENRTERPT